MTIPTLRVSLLVGSPAGPNSTSAALGGYLLQQLQQQGAVVQTLLLYQALRWAEGPRFLESAISEADLTILAAPLYADCAPGPVIKTMELLLAHRQGLQPTKRQKLMAIVNCGFPEARHNDVVLAIYRRFAQEAGFEWVGGLSLGMGAAIGGKPLEQVGGMVRNVRKALELTAAALAAGQAVPDEAVALMAKPMMPRWFYVLMGTRGFKRRAKQAGVLKTINAQPYLE